MCDKVALSPISLAQELPIWSSDTDEEASQVPSPSHSISCEVLAGKSGVKMVKMVKGHLGPRTTASCLSCIPID